MQNNNSMPLLADIEEAGMDEGGISISLIIDILWLRRYPLLAVFILVITVSIVQISQLIPRYTAEAVILVGTAKAQVVNVEEVLSGDMNRYGAASGEVEVLKSRGLIKKVINKYNLLDIAEFNPTLVEAKPPGILSFLNPGNWFSQELKQDMKSALGTDDAATIKLQDEEEKAGKLLVTAANIYSGKMTISNEVLSSVVKVAFESTDPKVAAKIANAHAETYIINQLEAKFEATEKATSWLNERLSDLRQKVEAAEQAVEIYRNKYSLGKDEGSGGIFGEQLSEINSMLIIAKSERAGAEARLRQIKKLVKSGADIETAGDVVASVMVRNLRQQESDLTQKMSEMAVEFGVKHPKMIRIKAELASLKAKISTEIKKVIGALENEVEVTKSKEYSLRGSLKNLESKTGKSRREEVQLRALKREANANRALFEQFLSRFKETTSTQGIQEADARIISEAEVPSGVSYPNTSRLYKMAFVLALGLALTTVYLLEMLHPGLRTPEQIEKLFDIPTLGIVPLVEGKIDPVNYVLEKPHSSFAEALNTLRVSLALSDPDKHVKTILISSAVPEEGKSTLSICMARGAAKAGHKVALIDADLRRPSLVKKMGMDEPKKGLTDLVIDHSDQIYDYMVKDEKSGLYLMTKGAGEYTSPTDIFTSKTMTNIIAQLKKEFDLVIFDTPPVMAVSDARALAPQVDKTVFTVRWDSTPRKVIKAALQQLTNAEPNLSGIVLQRVDLKQYTAYGYGDSGYYYHYGKYGQYYSG
jgi:capsular exopolysaccharide synthesis family protein